MLVFALGGLELDASAVLLAFFLLFLFAQGRPAGTTKQRMVAAVVCLIGLTVAFEYYDVLNILMVVPGVLTAAISLPWLLTPARPPAAEPPQ
jgi:hypothetical protein